MNFKSMVKILAEVKVLQEIVGRNHFWDKKELPCRSSLMCELLSINDVHTIKPCFAKSLIPDFKATTAANTSV